MSFLFLPKWIQCWLWLKWWEALRHCIVLWQFQDSIFSLFWSWLWGLFYCLGLGIHRLGPGPITETSEHAPKDTIGFWRSLTSAFSGAFFLPALLLFLDSTLRAHTKCQCQVHMTPWTLVVLVKSNPGYKSGFLDWSISSCLPNFFQNLVDSLPCRRQLFCRVLWKAAGDCLICENTSSKMPYSAMLSQA